MPGPRAAAPDRLKHWSLASMLAFLAAYALASAAARDADWPQRLRVAAALLPVPFFVSWLAVAVRQVRRLDELQQRMHLEALAVAFPLTLLLLMTLGTLQRVLHLSPADWSYRHVWPMVVVLYLVGLAVARRRYR